MFTRNQVFDFTRQEVCDDLERAIYISVSGTEGQLLSDRLEPWLELARPVSHNVATRILYWPEMTV